MLKFLEYLNQSNKINYDFFGNILQHIFNLRGHVDFYPNMGVASQPGCEFFDAVNAFSCSHLRAPIFYAESILLPKNFPAYRVEFSELSTGDKDYVRSRKKMDDMVYMGEGADPA